MRFFFNYVSFVALIHEYSRLRIWVCVVVEAYITHNIIPTLASTPYNNAMLTKILYKNLDSDNITFFMCALIYLTNFIKLSMTFILSIYVII